MQDKGIFVVLEGSDGSGKATQLRLLAARLQAAGYGVDTYDFPRYNEPSSFFVQRYLNGDYGAAGEISPFTASMFYALDRFEAAPQIRQSLDEGKIVLANRYTGSNMAHQGGKFSSSGEQRGFFVWADSLEFELLGIPRPGINLFLRVPAKVSYQLISQKQKRLYTDKSHDQHEADIEHLKKSVSTYDTMCRLFPKDYKSIECSKNGKILPITEINDRIWQSLKPLLPKPTHKGRPTTLDLHESDSPKKIEKSPHDAAAVDKLKIKIKDISLLAARELQSISEFNAKISKHNAPRTTRTRITYYIPSELPPKLGDKYRDTMDGLNRLRTKMLSSVSASASVGLKQLVDNTLPLAFLLDVDIEIKKSNSSEPLQRISRSSFGEVQQLAKVIASHLGLEDKPRIESQNLVQPLSKLINEIGTSDILEKNPIDSGLCTLLDCWPKNEFDLLVDELYPESTLSRSQISDEIYRWSYEQKSTALKGLVARGDKNLTRNARYHFDVICDYGTFQQILEHLHPKDLKAQSSTPRFGYEVPSEIEKLGLEDDYIECFDLSLSLYSQLQAADKQSIAGYTVLKGHRLRCQFSTDAERIFATHHDMSVAFSDLLRQLREKVAEAHSILGSSLIDQRNTKSWVSTDKSRQMNQLQTQAKHKKSKK